MDSLASLALATEEPKDALLERPPQSRQEHIVSRKMLKHILIMAFFQAIIVFTITFAGESFLPESNEQWQRVDTNIVKIYNSTWMEEVYDNGGEEATRLDELFASARSSYIMTGRREDWDQEELYDVFEWTVDRSSSRHFTIVFTAFVLMQIFNMVNARKIDDTFNILEGIHTNFMFIGVWVGIFVLQFFITQYTGLVFKVCKDGLTGIQWLICIICGFMVIPIDALIKFVPDSVCCCELGAKELDPMKDHDGPTSFRRKRSDSISLRQGTGDLK